MMKNERVEKVEYLLKKNNINVGVIVKQKKRDCDSKKLWCRGKRPLIGQYVVYRDTSGVLHRKIYNGMQGKFHSLRSLEGECLAILETDIEDYARGKLHE